MCYEVTCKFYLENHAAIRAAIGDNSNIMILDGANDEYCIVGLYKYAPELNTGKKADKALSQAAWEILYAGYKVELVLRHDDDNFLRVSR